MLFLHGGPDHEREVFRREGRGYWTSALGIVLEKHGLLGVRSCLPGELRGALRPGEPLLAGRLLPEMWTLELIDAIAESGVPVLFEVPLPDAVLARLGVTREGDVHPEAKLATLDARLQRAGRAYGYPPVGQLAPTAVQPVSRVPELGWQRFPEIGIDERQAAAWRHPGWDIEAWSVRDGTDVLAQWRAPDGAASAAIVRRGRWTAASYGIFCALAQAHTSEPYEDAEVRTSPRSIGHETLLLALLDDLHDEAHAHSARLLPWPAGARWALNVRHDFDRPLGGREVQRRLRLHAQAGTRATWYWRSRHVRPAWRGRSARERLHAWQGLRAIRAVAASPEHEVAWHTEQLWGDAAVAEREALEAVLQRPVAGTCAHGAPDCFRFQGAPNVLWADRTGLAYTELIQRSHLHPHRFAALRSDGRVEPLRIICLPHHESLDRSMQPGSANTERLVAVLPTFAQTGGLYQLMNHPDLNQPELFELLASFPRDGRLDLTAEEAADWWRRTHTKGDLESERVGDASWRLTARSAVQSLQVTLRAPGGSRVVRVADLAAGRPTVVS